MTFSASALGFGVLCLWALVGIVMTHRAATHDLKENYEVQMWCWTMAAIISGMFAAIFAMAARGA